MSILKQIIRGRNSSETYSHNINLTNPQRSTNLQQIVSTDIKAISVNNLIDSNLKELGSLMMSSVRHKNVSGQKLDTVFPFENGAVSGSLVQSKSMRATLNQQLVLLASAVFEGIHTLQANNSNQANELFFAFPFPHSGADAQAFCHYFEDQTPEGENQIIIKLTLSPEPIGTVEVSILKTEKRIDVTFNLERQQYRELFLENIEEFGEKLKSVGHQLINIHCSKLIRKETEELSLPGLYA